MQYTPTTKQHASIMLITLLVSCLGLVSCGDESPDVHLEDATKQSEYFVVKNIEECSLRSNCPPGDLCMPWSSDGVRSWDATRCTEIFDLLEQRQLKTGSD